MANVTEIHWDEKDRAGASYIGRNGVGKCLGLEFMPSVGHFVNLQPINSKGTIANCLIQIPTSQVGKVCLAMQADILDLVLTQLKDQLPRLMGLDPELDKLVSDKLKG